MALMRRTNVQQQEIAEYLGQTESSVSRQIQALVSRGFIDSRRDSNDRRQRVTRLTPKGEKLAVAATAELEKHFAPMFETLSLKKQADLAEMLDDMRDYVSNNVKYGFWTRARHKD
jgi:DNA-binding MarR family transcriptional regulator